MSDNKDKKEPELADIAANFVRDKNKRQKIFNTIGVAAEVTANVLTAGVYALSAVWKFGEKIAPTIISGLGKALDFGKRHSATWRGHMSNIVFPNDEFGSTKTRLPKGAKEWWQVGAFPVSVGAFLMSTTFLISLPFDGAKAAWAGMRDDPIYKMNKANDSDMTVAAQFVNENSKLTKEYLLRFKIPDNNWYDLTYMIGNKSLVGYDPVDEVISPLNASDSKVCAINSTFPSAYIFKMLRPSILGEPLCRDSFEELKEYLETDLTNPDTGEVIREAGVVYKDGPFYFYDNNPQFWDAPMRLAGDAIEGVVDAFSWAAGGIVDLVTPDEEAPTEGQENEENEEKPANPKTEGKTSMTDFISASYNNDNYKQSDMVVNVHFDKTVLPVMKIA